MLTILVGSGALLCGIGQQQTKRNPKYNQSGKQRTVCFKRQHQQSTAIPKFVLNKLEFTENELKILKNERDILELEEQQRGTRNKEELKVLKEQILKKEEMKKELQKYANTFEL